MWRRHVLLVAEQGRSKVACYSPYVHPFVAAYINQGIVSLKRKWQMKYGWGVKIYPNQQLSYLQYQFFDMTGEEIDMKDEKEMK